MKNIFTSLLVLLTFASHAQVATTLPVTPIESRSVVVTFNAAQGNQSLKGYAGTVYAHAGVITDKSGSDADWKYVVTAWGENTDKVKLTNKGNDLWELSITPNIRAYYGVPANEKILKLAFVFRSGEKVGGSYKEGKDTGDKDIFIDVSEDAFNLAITSPQKNTLFSKDSSITISATASEAANLVLYSNGTQLKTESSATTINHTISSITKGSYTITATAEAGGSYRYDTVRFAVRDTTEVAPLPAGMVDGINYDADDNTKATLVLFAPHKNYVFVIGDFNSWEMQSEYEMKRDSNRFWLTLTNLTPGKEYAYQYVIDGTLTVADAYTEKILDPWNDSYINSQTYPNLKPYPKGKTTGIVSVLQTAQTPYTWSGKPYTRPAKEKLNIYELLVRDFISTHTYSTIIDSLHYFKTLGINAIELLPTNEFEGNESWGYNPSFYFAADKYYGPKNELKRLVDSCHANGIAVIIDLVLNHSFGLSPMVQMYWDGANNRPATNSPWFNVTSPNPTYYWGSDFNHQSVYTQQFVDRVNCFWLNEYKVDGIRFDFTKGFTNTPGEGWNYDAQRISILKRMTDKIRECAPNTYVIFEHLTANNEEKELADYGIMLWGNVNNNSCEAIMGYNESSKSDLTGASYKSKGWNEPNLIAYMESHDEERMMYKAKKWGATNGDYDTKNEATALKRAALCATVFFSIPGPKMIWQFGELGYDYSINACPDGTEKESCRTSNKAIRWDYDANINRKNLYYHYAEILRLRNMYDVFSTTDFSTSLNGTVKTVTLRSNSMNVVVVGNFGLTNQNATLTLPSQGTWYEYFSQTNSPAAEVQNITLAPGEYRLYSDSKMDRLNIPFVTAVPIWYDNAPSALLHLYPNPVKDMLNVEVSDLKVQGALRLVVYNMRGERVLEQSAHADNSALTTTISCGRLAQGSYILSVQNSKGKQLAGKFFSK